MSRRFQVAALLGLLVLCLSSAYAQAPCDCGETVTPCFANPCVVSPPSPACKLSCVAKYCNGCQALCSCTNDFDCYSGEFCRPTSNPALSLCTPFSFTGESCGGFTTLQCRKQCAPGFRCVDTNPFVIDEPGLCYRFCEKGKCCGDRVYCATGSNTCLPLGRCETDNDCLPTVQSLPALGPNPAGQVCRYRCVPGTLSQELGTCRRVCLPEICTASLTSVSGLLANAP